jgi:hypothetical protein
MFYIFYGLIVVFLIFLPFCIEVETKEYTEKRYVYQVVQSILLLPLKFLFIYFELVLCSYLIKYMFIKTNIYIEVQDYLFYIALALSIIYSFYIFVAPKRVNKIYNPEYIELELPVYEENIDLDYDKTVQLIKNRITDFLGSFSNYSKNKNNFIEGKKEVEKYNSILEKGIHSYTFPGFKFLYLNLFVVINVFIVLSCLFIVYSLLYLIGVSFSLISYVFAIFCIYFILTFNLEITPEKFIHLHKINFITFGETIIPNNFMVKKLETLSKSEKDVKEKYALLVGLIKKAGLENLSDLDVLKDWSNLEDINFYVLEYKLNSFKEESSYCESFEELKDKY